jgi:lauroyl/myristoyl acyltransferase
MRTRVARVRRRGTFLVARTLVRLCGFDRCRPLGAVFGDWQYRLGVFKRRRCLADLAVLLGRAPGDPEVERTLRNAYRVNTMCSLEVVSMADRKLDARRLRECCRVDGIGNLEAARDGRGAILLANHACNSLLLLAQLAESGWPITVVYRRSPMMPESFVEEGCGNMASRAFPPTEDFAPTRAWSMRCAATVCCSR